MSEDRRQLSDARRATVTYSRVPPNDGPSPDSARFEPHLTATEVPQVASPFPDAEEPADLSEFTDAAAALVEPRRGNLRGMIVLGVVVVAALVLGVLALAPIGNPPETASAAAPPATAVGAGSAGEIASIKQQLEAVARGAAANAEDARLKTAALRGRLVELEEGQADAPRAVAAPAAEPPPDPATTEQVPAPVVAAVPPVPRVRPDPASVMPPAPEAAPLPADDGEYVKSIERILADTPSVPGQPAAAAPAITTARPPAIATEPPAMDGDGGITYENAPLPSDGPVPPEPIPYPDGTATTTGQ